MKYFLIFALLFPLMPHEASAKELISFEAQISFTVCTPEGNCKFNLNDPEVIQAVVDKGSFETRQLDAREREFSTQVFFDITKDTVQPYGIRVTYNYCIEKEIGPSECAKNLQLLGMLMTQDLSAFQNSILDFTGPFYAVNGISVSPHVTIRYIKVKQAEE